jgi:hypothetical protein
MECSKLHISKLKTHFWLRPTVTGITGVCHHTQLLVEMEFY